MTGTDTVLLLIAFTASLFIVVKVGDPRALGAVAALCVGFVLLGVTV